MASYFRLLRIPNLIIISLTLYAFRYLVVAPYYGMSGTEFRMDNLSFGLMVALTLLIAAAGYIGNDYYDLDIDRLNRPDKFPVNSIPKGRSLMLSALLLSFLSAAGIFILSIRMHCLLTGVVLFIALATVWWYAAILKRSFIWGNLAVSFMSAFTLGMIWFFEWLMLFRSGIDLYEIKAITVICIGICFFAFMLSLIREIVKDIEDMEGDSKFGCRSLPVLKGVKFTRKVISILIAILLASLIISQYWLLGQNFQLVIAWLGLFVELPLLIFLFRLFKAQTVPEFRKLSRFLKWIMVTGIASMGIIWLNFRF